jgi:hypothetical protein
MRYWFDTEFIEDGKTIDLISIGIVAEDGRELYLCNKECDFCKAGDWVWENVLYPIGIYSVDLPNPSDPSTSPKERETYLAMRSRQQIRDEVLKFCGGHLSESGSFELMPGTSKPEFWAYYADYDWVVFCQLFGTMMDLPDGFPMYCRDIKQEVDRLGLNNMDLPAPEGQESEHHALHDARWTKRAWEHLQYLDAVNSGSLLDEDDLYPQEVFTEDGD